jgi:hypothetical protein
MMMSGKVELVQIVTLSSLEKELWLAFVLSLFAIS